ncbi:hypothetical protein [Nocardia sp. No.11]|uniref:hypothetical protein n=1 Tax=Nocardia sp. No.11 TaxID=3128861 RepID=UPI00319DFA93
MAIYEKRVRIVRRTEYAVPGALPGGHGVPIAELYKAIAAAEADYRATHGTEPRHDDWLRLFAYDEEIVAVLEVESVQGA